MELITQTIFAIKKMTVPEHFKTEKGFIADFQSKLRQQLHDTEFYLDSADVEKLKKKGNPDHRGFKLEPGLVIHIPGEVRNESTTENNFMFIAFNFGRNPERVKNNFYTLNQMFEKLNYNTGILINIGRYPDTYLFTYGSNYNDRVHELSIDCRFDSIHIKHTYFTGQGIISEIV